MSVPPSADPTQWELYRALEQLRQDQHAGMEQLRDDLRADIAKLMDRIEQAVTKDVYAADQRALQLQITTLANDLDELARQRENDAAKAAATRRLVISSFAAPLLLFVLELWTGARP
ncbi:hypothetical protein ACFYWS_20605 [Streptomyces sp. NPDC002795]|uniref:hypothetical protein n=1 Tax=Streptomyces sp. NPDC002795 TaxID=3364665 RepID=UPI00369C2AA4